MMTELCQAILARFDSQANGQPNAFNQAVSGRFFLGEAPEETPTPYAVFAVPQDGPDTLFENCRVQFDVYDWNQDAAQVLAIAKALTDLFDWHVPQGLGVAANPGDPGNLGFIRKLGPYHVQSGQQQRVGVEYTIMIQRGE